MATSDGLAKLLGRDELPAAFERWRVELEDGAQRPTSGEEWAGAMVWIERGRLEVECLAGGCRTFEQGDLLVLGLLPLKSMRNPGHEQVRLVAIRRRGRRPTSGFLSVQRVGRIGSSR